MKWKKNKNVQKLRNQVTMRDFFFEEKEKDLEPKEENRVLHYFWRGLQ